MKKALFAAMAAVLLLAGCKDEDWCSMVREKEDAFMEYFFSLDDSAMPQEKAEQLLDSSFSALQQDVEAIAAKGLKKHNDDSVAVFLVSEMYNLEILDNDGLFKAIQDLGPNAQADPAIVKLKANVEKVMATGEGAHFLDFSAEQPDGSVKSLSDYAGKGKYCLVDFWASWCAPCKEEIPNIRKVYEKYGPEGLNVVSVAVWDKPEDTETAAKENGVVWNQIVNAQNVPTDLYGIGGIPHIMLIGPDGTILKRDLRGSAIGKEVGKYF